jgi:hypothetical protein
MPGRRTSGTSPRCRWVDRAALGWRGRLPRPAGAVLVAGYLGYLLAVLH